SEKKKRRKRRFFFLGGFGMHREAQAMARGSRGDKTVQIKAHRKEARRRRTRVREQAKTPRCGVLAQRSCPSENMVDARRSIAPSFISLFS
ncbi:MAG: hypothetical protein IKC73_00395, partial [Clostridia bacterium]|nr:hypothetical protein [Clostridia bacterium]